MTTTDSRASQITGPLRLYETLVNQAKRGWLTPSQVKLVWDLYIKAVESGTVSLVDAEAIWRHLLGQRGAGTTTFDQVLVLWEAYLRTGLLSNLAGPRVASGRTIGAPDAFASFRPDGPLDPVIPFVGMMIPGWDIPAAFWKPDGNGGGPVQGCYLKKFRYPSDIKPTPPRELPPARPGIPRGWFIGFRFEAEAEFVEQTIGNVIYKCGCCEFRQHAKVRFAFSRKVREPIRQDLGADDAFYEDGKVTLPDGELRYGELMTQAGAKGDPDNIKAVESTKAKAGNRKGHFGHRSDEAEVEATEARKEGKADPKNTMRLNEMSEGYMDKEDVEGFKAQLDAWKRQNMRGPPPRPKQDKKNGCVYWMQDAPALAIYEGEIALASFRFRGRITTECDEMKADDKTNKDFEVMILADYTREFLVVTMEQVGGDARLEQGGHQDRRTGNITQVFKPGDMDKLLIPAYSAEKFELSPRGGRKTGNAKATLDWARK